MTYRTAPAAARDHAAMRALCDGTDWPPTIDARAERVAERARKFAACAHTSKLEAAVIAAWVAYTALPDSADPRRQRRKDEAAAAYLDARDALRRVSKEAEL